MTTMQFHAGGSYPAPDGIVRRVWSAVIRLFRRHRRLYIVAVDWDRKSVTLADSPRKTP